MANVLMELSDSLAGTVETVGRGTVRVEGRRRLPASGIAWSRDGLVVTAHHVLEQDEDIRVGLPDGEAVTASVVGRDPTTDVAVLRVEAGDLTPPALAGPDEVKVGELVLAIGRPGKSARATLGIVSVLGKEWHTRAGGRLDRYLQTDVVMYPGFSGGPLAGASGEVLGLNTSALVRGASVAVPVATLHRVVDTLVAHGRVRRGYLGVGTQPVRLPADVAQGLERDTGLLVVSVEPGSPAHGDGLVLGDTIVALDGAPVRHLDDLLALLTEDRIGGRVPLQVLRGGRLQDMSVAVGERP